MGIEGGKQVEEKVKSRKVCKVLIIDDNKDLAEILCDLVGFLGHKTICAHSGYDGIKKAREFMPDAVICDIGLPGMNGYEVAKTMRKDFKLKKMYLVALSGYAGPDDLKLSRESGFDRHLSKPADISAIERVLAEAAIKMQEI